MVKWKYFSEAEFIQNVEWNDSQLEYKGMVLTLILCLILQIMSKVTNGMEKIVIGTKQNISFIHSGRVLEYEEN